MKSSKMPNLVTILILTLITVVVWVSFDVIRLFNTNDTPVVPEEVSRPLDPILDQDLIYQIDSQIFLDNSEVPDQVGSEPEVIEPVITPEPTPSPEV